MEQTKEKGQGVRRAVDTTRHHRENGWDYRGGYTTNYYNQYGGSTGSATTRSNYDGGTTTNYYDKYGSSIGSSTTRKNYGGGTTTTFYDAFGNSLGSSFDW